MSDILFDISIVIILATMVAYIARLFKQPLIPAYILTGLILGPVLGLVTNTEVISTLSEIGIAFLLFLVGLEIDIRKLREVGLVASLGGIVQVVAVFVPAFIAALLLGFLTLEAAYVAIVIALSSTMVVIKILSDRKELDTLQGKIVIGILLLQDLVAIIALSVFATLSSFSPFTLILGFLKGIAAVGVAIIVSKYGFPAFFAFAAKSQELLLISAVSTSLLYALIFNYLGFSIAIGAFVAGVSLANLPYNIEIIGKVKSLRDFFSVMFFVSIGLSLVLGDMMNLIVPFLILLAMVIIMKPLIMMLTISYFGYKRRVSFLSSLYLAQISEFSLIIVTQGLLLGHISNELFSLAVWLAIFTITLTTYLVNYEQAIYRKIAHRIRFFEKLAHYKPVNEKRINQQNNQIIICGHNRIGYGIVRTLLKLKQNILIVDYNPEIIKLAEHEDVQALYGDIGDSEVLDRLNFKKTRMVISTLPTKTENVMLIRAAKKEKKSVVVFVTSTNLQDALELYDAGADYVVLPHFLGGDHVSLIVEDINRDLKKIINHRLRHMKELKERHALGHR